MGVTGPLTLHRQTLGCILLDEKGYNEQNSKPKKGVQLDRKQMVQNQA